MSATPLRVATPLRGRGGERRRLVRTSLVEVPGAQQLDCAGGPLWIVESYEMSAKPTERAVAGSRPSSSA